MESLHTFLTARVADCQAKATALTADSRYDEAVFEKVRGNVFDIFRTVLETARKTDHPEAFFRARLTDIPAHWSAALEQAERHRDSRRAHTEQFKLEAVREIEAHLNREAPL